MLGSELVGVVDTVVAGVAEGCFVGGAVHRGLVFVTDITQDLHLLCGLIGTGRSTLQKRKERQRNGDQKDGGVSELTLE